MNTYQELDILSVILSDSENNKYTPPESQQNDSHKSCHTRYLIKGDTERDKVALSKSPDNVADKIDYEKH